MWCVLETLANIRPRLKAQRGPGTARWDLNVLALFFESLTVNINKEVVHLSLEHTQINSKTKHRTMAPIRSNARVSGSTQVCRSLSVYMDTCRLTISSSRSAVNLAGSTME